MKTLFFLLSLIFLSSTSKSQDCIFLLKGDTIKAQVINLTKTSLNFIATGAADTTSIEKTEISKIVYRNGTIVNLNLYSPPLTIIKTSVDDSLYNLGRMHAQLYYDRYKPSFTGTLITSILTPIYGLAPAIACSNTRPKNQNLTFPNLELSKNQVYYSGYSDAAYKIKKKKVWKGYFIGSGISIGAIFILPLILNGALD